jgi:dienelactone hydrolase
MVINEPADFSHYDREHFKGPDLECELFVSKTGKHPVLLLHEIPAITPEVAHLGATLNGAGYKVYMPSLLGDPGAVPSAFEIAGSVLVACVRSNIAALQQGDHTRGAVQGLKALARRASADCGGKPVGVIGLCLTGGFAIATAVEPVVTAAVASEPSLPFAAPSHVDLSDDDQKIVAARGKDGSLRTMVLRFETDSISPCPRVRRYGDLLGDAVVSRCLTDADADKAFRGGRNPHSVLTNSLVEDLDHPERSATQRVLNEVLGFLDWRLRDGKPPAPATDVRDCLIRGCARKGGPVARGGGA